MDQTVPAMAGMPRSRDNPLTRSLAGLIGLAALIVLIGACVGSLPWTLGASQGPGSTPRYEEGLLAAYLLPPTWAPMKDAERERYESAAIDLGKQPVFLFGTDKLGRDVFVRTLAGGGVSIGIGLAAAAISVFIGTLYGSLAGYVGGRTDAVMMRIVDVLYGLPYILLVVLLAVVGDSLVSDAISRRPQREAYVVQHAREVLAAPGETLSSTRVEEALDEQPELRARLEAEARTRYPAREMSPGTSKLLEVTILLVAIGGVSWLTMARVVRGQVLSLKTQPFMEAARAIGVPVWRQFLRHLLPNLLGPIIVYATLTVPQAILQESFLSFLGIGVQPPLPSWGNLAADGLTELNPVRVRWWLIVFPCAMLGITLLALNFVGEGLREAFDPRRAKK